MEFLRTTGLLLEEIPGILNIGADREPVAGEITIRPATGIQSTSAKTSNEISLCLRS
jgi:hypothetical protein